MQSGVKPAEGPLVDVSLRYGRSKTVLRVPERHVAGIYRPMAPPEVKPASIEGSAGLEALRRATAGRRVIVLVPDGTRAQTSRELIDPLFRALRSTRTLNVAIATGSHRADTEANRNIGHAMREAARAGGAPLSHVTVHDCRSDPFKGHGTTSRGTPILLSEVLDAAEQFVVIADVKHHYFAGYSNPLKFFLPGLSAYETIEANHRLALEPDSTYGRHPFHPDPDRRTNPLAEDMAEAFATFARGRPAFALVTVTAGGRAIHAEVGPLRDVSARAFAVADQAASVPVPRAAYLVVSAGGAPQDATLYLAQRAIELTKVAALDGAEILWLAECAEGIADGDTARENFYDELTRPLPEVLARIRGGYRLYQHKAYKLAELMTRIAALHLTSNLVDDAVRAIHLVPANDPQALVDSWIARDPRARIAFFDEANRLSVRAA